MKSPVVLGESHCQGCAPRSATSAGAPISSWSRSRGGGAPPAAAISTWRRRRGEKSPENGGKMWENGGFSHKTW